MIVGNPGHMLAGEKWFSALIWSAPRHAALGLADTSEAYLNSWSAQAGFIDTVRQDLQYLPRWWQIWRPVWWSVRVRAWRRKRGQRALDCHTRKHGTPDAGMASA
ncbi:hypothetical protein [Streptomyces sp. MMBL 11-3]|uniref:hypothetical protein n=1 Tax=Streptomyces sp. MMBL 11-3 TaxID=3382639 RepID=UPI0039B383E7